MTGTDSTDDQPRGQSPSEPLIEPSRQPSSEPPRDEPFEARLAHPDPVVASRVSGRWPLYSGGISVVLVLLLGVIIFLRGPNSPFVFDEAWMSDMVAARVPALEQAAFVMNALGGGIIATFVVPLLIIAVMFVLRRPWAALYFALATALSAGLVQVLKDVVGRSRPEDILVNADFGSFPSGHSANAATMAVALAIIFPRVWVWAAGAAYTLLMMLSRTYLGAHWLSDTIGGLLLGVGVALIVAAPLASRLSHEPRPRKPRPVAGSESTPALPPSTS